MPYRVLNVEFMVFDDSTLPKRSSMDLVLHPAFATQLPEWIQGSARSDTVSQGFSRGLMSGSFFTIRPTITPATGRLWPYSAPGTLPSDEGAHDTRRIAVWRGIAQRFSQVFDAPEDSANDNLTSCWCSPECSMPTPLGADARRECRNGGSIVHTFWHCPERLKVHGSQPPRSPDCSSRSAARLLRTSLPWPRLTPSTCPGVR